MQLYFITSSKNKFVEAKSILGVGVKQLDLDLPEIQGTDAKEIIKAKLEQAFRHKKGEFLVEDTSLYLDCLGGLPGPLIKWFLKTVGNQGLVSIAEKLKNQQAEAKTIIGYAKKRGQVYFFEGAVKGRIVRPKGDAGFGWDQIFQPDGFRKTFAQMDPAEKNLISMRRIVLNNLQDSLKKDHSSSNA